MRPVRDGTDEAGRLHGCHILVVEDEYMIAREVSDQLHAAGALTLGPVPTVADALGLLARHRVDAALLDVNLRGEGVWPVVDALRARGVPVVLVTGYDAGAIPPAYAGLPRREKPVDPRHLVATLARVLAPGRSPDN